MTRAEHKDEELEIRSGVAGKEHAILPVADGALDFAEFGRRQPFASEIGAKQQQDRCRYKVPRWVAGVRRS